MREAVSEPLRKHAGIELSPHLYRHIIAKIVAERAPELLTDLSRASAISRSTPPTRPISGPRPRRRAAGSIACSKRHAPSLTWGANRDCPRTALHLPLEAWPAADRAAGRSCSVRVISYGRGTASAGLQPPAAPTRSTTPAGSAEVGMHRVGQSDDLGGPAATRAADGLALSPPFAPCPWRWTLTMLPSIIANSRSGSSGQGIENAFENIGLHPMPEPFEYRVPVPEIRRQVAPRSAGAGNPQHRLKKQPRIATRAPRVGRLAQTMRLDLRPLRIRQHQSRHRLLPFGSLNQNQPALGILNLNRP